MSDESTNTISFPAPWAEGRQPRKGIELCTEEDLERCNAVFRSTYRDGKITVTMRPGRLRENRSVDRIV